MIRVPSFDVIGIRNWLARHELVLVDGVDVDTDVLPHETHPESMSVATNFERFASHGTNLSAVVSVENLPIDHIGVSYYSHKLGVSITRLRALVDVGGSTKNKTIVRDHGLAVDIDLLGREYTRFEFRPSPQREEGDVVVRLPSAPPYI